MDNNFIIVCGDYLSFIKNGKIMQTRSADYRDINSLDEKKLRELLKTLERKNFKKDKAVLIESKNENDLMPFNAENIFKEFIDTNIPININQVKSIFDIINKNNVFGITYNNIVLKNKNKINKTLLNNKSETENVFEIYIGDNNIFWSNRIQELEEKVEKVKVRRIPNELNDLIELIEKTLKEGI